MASKEVLALEVDGQVWVAYSSKTRRNESGLSYFLEKAPIDANDVAEVFCISRTGIFNIMFDFQNKIEKETGVFPKETHWVSGVRNIKKIS